MRRCRRFITHLARCAGTSSSQVHGAWLKPHHARTAIVPSPVRRMVLVPAGPSAQLTAAALHSAANCSNPNTHARPFHHACIVPSPVAAALHSAARQVAVEVSSTPTTHTPTAPIVTPPLSSPRSLSPSACLPRHHGFSFGSAFPAWLALPHPTRRRFVLCRPLPPSSRKGKAAVLRKRAFVSSDRRSFRIDVPDRSCA
jgi:hypothetical protein